MDAGNFTEAEKRFVLAEYIKASQVDTDQLVAFIKTYNLQADWFQMQLPGGRNMHQCIAAASSMLDIEVDRPSMPSLKKRKSAGDLLSEQPPKRLERVASMNPILYQPRPASRPQVETPPLPQLSPQLQQLQQQQQQSQAGAASRAIQPRPAEPKSAPAEGYSVFPSKTPANGYNVFQSNPTGRKRGRPSKAEKEAQARANTSAYVTPGPIPISPKPAAQPGQAPSSAPLVGVTGPPSSFSTYAAAASVDPRSPRLGGRGLPLPLNYPEQQHASLLKSEKSPSIGNLVTPDPPPGDKGPPTPMMAPSHSRDPPPVTSG